ncbi:MAG: cobalamin-dependent protein, partial [Lentisphaeria bacterium]|nr:cobalamin-dependent protein [Lentisphaeria bacterium]
YILDVNVGLPEIDEASMLRNAVCELQAVIKLPLQIDTADPIAMEGALRRYNGKAMINSVSGKKAVMDAVFPLVKKYGGVVVALTLDDDGIPATAEKRLEIAKRILDVAASYGIDKKDIVFDTLAMTISADQSAGEATLEALARIRTELGCHTSLGVSNISFGLPNRDAINGVFFTMALTRGLSAAIMNPNSLEMMKVYHSYLALKGMDENCLGYLEFAPQLAAAQAAAGVQAPAASVPSGEAAKSALQDSVVKGLKEQAGVQAQALLEGGTAPMELVQNELIPALDIVGRNFEAKKAFLPQLLMSAEAAKAAFEKVKQFLLAHPDKSAETSNVDFVLATVHGDIHDIGKNIVHLLLENYGFRVWDLGKDVPPEAIVAAAIEHHAPLVGLSALMTTTVPDMEETIKQLRKGAPWAKVIVGGAVLTKEYAEKIGADFYAKDAMDTVRHAKA